MSSHPSYPQWRSVAVGFQLLREAIRRDDLLGKIGVERHDLVIGLFYTFSLLLLLLLLFFQTCFPMKFFFAIVSNSSVMTHEQCAFVLVIL